MGKAKDGTNCYKRFNKKGGEYITCEGTQRTYNKNKGSSTASRTPRSKPKAQAIKVGKKTQKSIDLEPTDTDRSSPTGKPPSKKYNKAKLEDRIDTKIRQLDGRSWKSGKGKAKNPHKAMKKNNDGTATTGALKEIVSKFEKGILKDNDTNRVMYEASKKVISDRKKK